MIQMKNYYIVASICFWDISLWKAWRKARDLGDMSQKYIDETINCIFKYV